MHLLVCDHLGILVTAPGQGHDKDPRGDLLASKSFYNVRTGSEIDLGGLGRAELQDGCGLWMSVFQFLQ